MNTNANVEKMVRPLPVKRQFTQRTSTRNERATGGIVMTSDERGLRLLDAALRAWELRNGL